MTKKLRNTPRPKYLPTNDVIFKCLLGNPGNERITKSFLKHITGEEIEEISTNFKLELLKEKPKDKQMVADLIAKDKYLQKYIVEMQRKAYDYLPDRFIAYLSKTYVADIKVKEDYKKLKRTVLVVLMEEDFPNLENIQEYHTVWHYREENHREKILTKNTEVHILELQKYKRHKKQTGEIDPWLEFFINPYGKEVQDMARTRAELEEAKEDDVNFELFKAPIELTEQGVKYIETKNEVSEDGKVSTITIEGTEGMFECDSVIIAVSQSPRKNIVANTTGLDTNKWGLLLTDDKGHTTRNGVFASGDVVTGANTVVHAVSYAKIVAESIEEYCNNNK